MSITRSSIPVCISGGCRDPRCVSPSLIPALSHRPLSVTRPVPPLLGAAVPPAGPPGTGVWGWRSAIPARSSSEIRFPPLFPSYLLYFLFNFLFPSCASLFLTLLDSFLPFSPQFLLAQDAFQHQVPFTALLFLKMVDKNLSLDALETMRHPKVSSTFLEEEHYHPEHKVRTPRFE